MSLVGRWPKAWIFLIYLVCLQGQVQAWDILQCGLPTYASASGSSISNNYLPENVKYENCERDYPDTLPGSVTYVRYNYWLAQDKDTMTYEFPCTTNVTHFVMKNTHNDKNNDAGTFKFKITDLDTNEIVLQNQLDDVRNMGCNVNNQIFLLDNVVQLNKLEYKLVDIYGNYGGLQYFDVGGVVYLGENVNNGKRYQVRVFHASNSHDTCIDGWDFASTYSGYTNESELVLHYPKDYNTIFYVRVATRNVAKLEMGDDTKGIQINFETNALKIYLNEGSLTLLHQVSITGLTNLKDMRMFWIKVQYFEGGAYQNISVGRNKFWDTPLISYSLPSTNLVTLKKLCFGSTHTDISHFTVIEKVPEIQHAEYNPWSEWTACGPVCGPGKQIRTRRRTCNMKRPLGLGFPCYFGYHHQDYEECQVACNTTSAQGDVAFSSSDRPSFSLSKVYGNGDQLAVELGDKFQHVVKIDLPPSDPSLQMTIVAHINTGHLENFLNNETSKITNSSIAIYDEEFNNTGSNINETVLEPTVRNKQYLSGSGSQIQEVYLAKQFLSTLEGGKHEGNGIELGFSTVFVNNFMQTVFTGNIMSPTRCGPKYGYRSSYARPYVCDPKGNYQCCESYCQSPTYVCSSGAKSIYYANYSAPQDQIYHLSTSAAVLYGSKTDVIWAGMTGYFPGEGSNIAHDLVGSDNILGDSWEMSVGSSYLYQITAYLTNPACDLEFEIAQVPYEMATLHFGKPSVEFGTAFHGENTAAFPKGRLVHLPTPYHPDGQVSERRWSINALINTDTTRDIMSDVNKIVISVPITLMSSNPAKIHKLAAILSTKIESNMGLTLAPLLTRETFMIPNILTFEHNITESDQPADGDGASPTVAGDMVSINTDPVFPLNAIAYKGTLELGSGLTSLAPEFSPCNGYISLNDSVDGLGYVPPQIQSGSNVLVENLLESTAVVDFYAYIQVLETNANGDKCTLTLGDFSQEITFNLTEATPESSSITAQTSYYSFNYLYKSDQVAIGVDLTIPIDSAFDYFNVTFQPVLTKTADGYPHLMRVCRAEIMLHDDDSDDLLWVPISKKTMNSTYYKSLESVYAFQLRPDSWSTGEIAPFVFPGKTNRTGIALGDRRMRNKLQMRAIYENLPGQEDYFTYAGSGPIDRPLTTILNFKNGSSWVGQHNFYLYKDPSEAFERLDSWSSCLGGWRTLPSSNMICHVASTSYANYQAKQDYCRKLGGRLLEILTVDDAAALRVYYFRLVKTHGKATGAPVTIGAIPHMSGNTSRWIWEHSREEVQLGTTRLIKPLGISNTDPAEGNYLFLDFNAYSTTGSMYGSNPPFTQLVGLVTTDMNSEFTCMKNGDKNDMINPTFEMEPMSVEYKATNRWSVKQIKYNLKMRHGTKMPFKLKMIGEESTVGTMKICKIQLLHVGNNYPCLQDPLYVKHIQNSARLEYDLIYPNIMSVTFDQIANWGEGPFNEVSPLDDDSIQIGVLLIPEPTGNGELYVKEEVTMYRGSGVTTTTNNIYFNVSKDYEPPIPTLPASMDFEVNPEGGSYDLIKGMCKRIVFKFKPPINEYTSIYIQAENTDFAGGKYIHWCGLTMKRIGQNYPCTNNNDFPWRALSTLEGGETKNNSAGTTEFYKKITSYLRYLQYYPVSPDPKEDEIEVELSVRADKELPPMQFLDVMLRVFISGMSYDKSVRLKIVELTEQNSPATVQTRQAKNEDKMFGIPKISNFFFTPLSLAVRDRGYVRQKIAFPRNSTLRTEILVETPVYDGRAVLNIFDIRFYYFNGRSAYYLNVLGVNTFMDVERTFNMTRGKSSNLKTHMQSDSYYVDMGYVTSAGYDAIWDNRNKITTELDNFYLEIGVEMTDNALTTPSSRHKLTTAVKVGDFILTQQSLVEVNRTENEADRRLFFRPMLVYNLSVAENSPSVYTRNDTINLTSIVHHHNKSMAEARPFIYRILLDQYTEFVEGKNYVTTNYTGETPVNYTVRTDYTADKTLVAGNYLEILFPEGVMFPDIIEVNFSLSVDPRFKREPKLEEYKSYVQVSGVGIQTQFFGYPKDGPGGLPMPTSLGNFEVFEATINNADCVESIIEIMDPKRQIQASYRLDSENATAPENIVSEVESWTAPFRSGQAFTETTWFQVDMMSVRRVLKVTMDTPSGSRLPSTFRLDYSNNGKHFSRGQDAFYKFDKSLQITKPIVGRFIRFVITKTSAAAEDMSPIKIFNLQLYGCADHHPVMPPVTVPATKPPRKLAAVYSFENTTIASTDPINYRQFVEDVGKSILYFCDRSPYRTGPACYTMPLITQQKFVGLPLFVNNVLGFSISRGRAYFQDKSGTSYMSCYDGRRIDVLSKEEFLKVSSASDYKPAITVPGENSLSLNNEPMTYAPASSLKAKYHGFYSKDSTLKIRWSSCCSPLEEE